MVFVSLTHYHAIYQKILIMVPKNVADRMTEGVAGFLLMNKPRRQVHFQQYPLQVAQRNHQPVRGTRVVS